MQPRDEICKESTGANKRDTEDSEDDDHDLFPVAPASATEEHHHAAKSNFHPGIGRGTLTLART